MFGMSFKTIAKIALITCGAMYGVNQAMAVASLSSVRPLIKSSSIDMVTV